MRDWSISTQNAEPIAFQFPGFALMAFGADSRIGRILLPAFHNLQTQNPIGPVYEWHLADIPESAGNSLGLPNKTQYGAFAPEGDPPIWIERRGPVINALEIKSRRLTTLALQDQLVQSDQSAKPLLRFLFSMTEANGWFLTHAALVGFEGNGILVPGSGGAGKSTLSAACALSGAEFVGDDFIAVQPVKGGWRGHALFNTLMLFEEQAQKFSKLPRATESDGVCNSRKQQLFVRSSDGFNPVQSLCIKGIALPKIVQSRESALTQGNKAANAKAILPHSALLSPPVRNVNHAMTLLTLAQDIEAFTYESGSDYQRTAQPLKEKFCT
ncbi:MAG: hypothetical protein ACU0AZ_04330 [Paracoccaceae bacterium]